MELRCLTKSLMQNLMMGSYKFILNRLFVKYQGEKGDMGQEGNKGDKGETGLKGKEGLPGSPGLIGVRVCHLSCCLPGLIGKLSEISL